MLLFYFLSRNFNDSSLGYLGQVNGNSDRGYKLIGKELDCTLAHLSNFLQPLRTVNSDMSQF